jgi:hypothetical protein
MDSNNQKNYLFTEEQITEFSSFSDTLRKIHNRLMSEGYTLKDGQLIAPVANQTQKEMV